MPRKTAKNLLWIALLVIAAGVQIWEQAQKNSPPSGSSRSPTSSRSPASSREAPSTPSRKAPSTGFETLTGCRLHPDRNNDGDSFKIAHQNRILELRLYFVDAPEKRLHQYNGERLDHQGRYFGGLNRTETTDVGQQAKTLTDRLLTTRPFRVVTRWQPVFESGRFYAFIFFEDTGEELSEILVREGLARIYTEGTTLPDGRSKAAFEQHLKQLEKTARQSRQGAWSLRASSAKPPGNRS